MPWWELLEGKYLFVTKVFPLPYQEAFIQECELLRSDLLQHDLDIQGEFVSEQTMEQWGWTEILEVI